METILLFTLCYLVCVIITYYYNRYVEILTNNSWTWTDIIMTVIFSVFFWYIFIFIIIIVHIRHYLLKREPPKWL